MAMDASASGLASVRTKLNFNLNNPWSFVFAIDAGNSPTLANNGTISIINNATPAPITTYVTFTDTSATFSIAGNTKTIGLTMGGGSFTWRRFSFGVSTVTNTATWSLDGVVQHSASYAVAQVHLYLTEQGGGLTLFDNLLITFSTAP